MCSGARETIFKQEIKKMGLVNLPVCRWKGEILLLSANISGEQRKGDRGITQANRRKVYKKWVSTV